MSKILCITTGLTGISYASLELVSRLLKDGHQVSYACPRERGDLFQKMGIPYYQLPEIEMDTSTEIPPFKGSFQKVKRLIYKYRFGAERRKLALDKIEPKAFIDLLKKENFDLLIIDIELHEYIISAHELKVPTLLLSQWFSIWRRKGLPYILSDQLPEIGSKSMKLKWAAINRQRKFTFFKKRLLSAGTDRRSMLLALANAKQFPKRFIGENYWPGPFLYNELPVISMTAEALEFPHVTRENLHYVGPVVHKEREEHVSESLRKAVVNAQQEGQKIIYCSVSTLHAGDIDFLRKVINAVEENTEWFLIVGLGGKLSSLAFENKASNILLMDSVPQIYVLNNADCSINHGGIHTINECIVCQVPMLIYSGKRSDQNGCASRVHYHEIGIMADKDKDSSVIISTKINEILTNKKYLRNIEVLSRACNKYLENKTVETIVHEYLNRKELLT